MEAASETTYFVVKSFNKPSLLLSHENSEWACCDRNVEPQPRILLTQAFNKGRVCLLFSVNNCHGWHGYAWMQTVPSDSPVRLQQLPDEDVSNSNEISAKMWFKFKIIWGKLLLKLHQEQCLLFEKTQHLFCVDKTPVNQARNFQEVGSEAGSEICELLDEKYLALQKFKFEKEQQRDAKLPPPFFTLPLIATNVSHAEVWDSILKKVEELGSVLLACAFGSQRYNCHTESSDMDMFIVYQAKTKDLLGFSPPPHTIKNREGERFDYTVMELHRFCELLLVGDPRCVETLFLHPTTVYRQAPVWEYLLQNRDLFITRQVCEKYLHDALGAKGRRLLEKWEKQGKASSENISPAVGKLFYIIIRLLQNAKQIVDTSTLSVYRENDSEERKILMKVRSGEFDYAEMRTVIECLATELNACLDTHTWRRLDSKEANGHVEELLIRLRYDNLHTYITKDNSKKLYL